jgi:hypothetical protein
MKPAQVISRFLLILFVAVALTAGGAQLVFAQENVQDNQDDYSHVRIVRLSFVVGEVQYQRADEDWQDAPMNLPIQEGFRLATGNGRAEIEFEDGAILRLAENTKLEFTTLALSNGARITQLDLVQGTILIQADMKRDDKFSVTAPNLQLTVPHSSRFRIDTTQGDSWVAVFKGEVAAASASGETRLTSGHTLHISAANPEQVNIDRNADLDDFDRWAADRDRVLQQGYSQVAPYIANYSDNSYIYGVSDLSSYGQFTVVPGYGVCWQPNGVPGYWSPFSNGYFNFFGGIGWTWLSFEPWGWLPFHTGNWFFQQRFGWFWQPGPFRTWFPAPVRWVRINNQLGWVPRGTWTHGVTPPATGVMTGGGIRNGVIRPGERITVTPEIAGRISTERAPAPFVRTHDRTSQGANGSTVGTPPARTWTREQRGPIVMDPATRTYINTHPAGGQAPAVAPPRRAPLDPTKDSAGPPATQENVNRPAPSSTATPRSDPRNHENPQKESASPLTTPENVAPANPGSAVSPRSNPRSQENPLRDSAGPPATQENVRPSAPTTTVVTRTPQVPPSAGGVGGGGGGAPAMRPTPVPSQPVQQQSRPTPPSQPPPQQHYSPPPQQAPQQQHSSPPPAPAPAPASHSHGSVGGGGGGGSSAPPPSTPPPPKGGRGSL